MATTMTGRFARIPERVLIEEMDAARRMRDQADRIHDRIAYELGFERVMVNHVQAGDQLRNGAEFQAVEKIEHRVDEVSTSWFSVLFGCDEHGAVVKNYEDGEYVSRLLPDESQQPF